MKHTNTNKRKSNWTNEQNYMYFVVSIKPNTQKKIYDVKT
jgi:hypothetical protein